MNTRALVGTLTAAQLIARARRVTARLPRLRDQDPRGPGSRGRTARLDGQAAHPGKTRGGAATRTFSTP